MTTTRRRRAKSANGRGGTYFNQSPNRWVARATLTDDEGNRVRRSWYGQTEAEARAKMDDAVAASRRGELTVSAGRAMTVEQWMEEWLGALDVRPTTLSRYQEIAERHINPALGSVPLPRLSVRQVNLWLRERKESGLGAGTVGHIRNVLKAALQAAVQEGLLPRNVARDSRPVRQEHVERPMLAPAQLVAFLVTHEDHQDAPLWRLLASTGMRLGEAQGLTWGAIDLEAGTLTVKWSLARRSSRWFVLAPKTTRSRRTMRLPAVAVEALREQQRRQSEAKRAAGAAWSSEWAGYVFLRPDDGCPSPPTSVLKRFQTALDAADLPRQRLHDLRHFAASAMLAGGVPLPAVSAALGHSNTHVTGSVYAHLLEQLDPRAAVAMDRTLNLGQVGKHE